MLRYTQTFNGWITEEHLFDYSFYDFKQVWVFDDYALGLDSNSEKIWAIFYKQKKFKDLYVEKNYMVPVNSDFARLKQTFERVTFRDAAKNGRWQMIALIRKQGSLVLQAFDIAMTPSRNRGVVRALSNEESFLTSNIQIDTF